MPTRGSSERLAKYRQGKARDELGWPHTYGLWSSSFIAVASLVQAARRFPDPNAWTSVAVAIGFGVLAYGLYRFQPWTRPVTAVIFALGAASHALSRDEFLWPLQVSWLAVAAIFLCLPSTGRLFVVARGAKDQVD